MSLPGASHKFYAAAFLFSAHVRAAGIGVLEIAKSLWRFPRRFIRVAIAPFKHDGCTIRGLRRSVSGVASLVALTVFQIFCSAAGMLTPEVVFGWLRLHEKLLRFAIRLRIHNIYVSQNPLGVLGCEERVFRRLDTEVVPALNAQIAPELEDRIRSQVFDEMMKRLPAYPRGMSLRPLLSEVILGALRAEIGIAAPQPAPAQPQQVPRPAAPAAAPRNFLVDNHEEMRQLLQQFLNQQAMQLAMNADRIPEEGDPFLEIPAEADALDEGPAPEDPFWLPVSVALPPALQAFQTRLLDAIEQEAKSVYDEGLYSAEEVRDLTTAFIPIINRATFRIVREEPQVMKGALAVVSDEAKHMADVDELKKNIDKLSPEEKGFLPYYLCTELDRCRRVQPDLHDLDSLPDVKNCFEKIIELANRFVLRHMPSGERPVDAFSLPSVPKEK